ncbi:tetratricopeptide repeat protein [Kitasatospora acidiphila]|uniref:Tetratricopeptide repeat protein n=1 Tax=Kitasatospora acidiphila TaxID=2567942 RepID=A0A540WEX4_9ACTN|nr:tetratricopeptide repeat protein [Kitasatospora acidiphila]TQF06964.1 tetratricopeptide repeat protein [Kitasatospora acidiphila]
MLLRGLGVDAAAVPEDPDAAAALLRTTLAGTRTLLVLDDAAGLTQVRPLLPSGPGCGVLVTCRSPLLALDGATHIRLATLTEAESVTLVALASGRCTEDREVVPLEQADLARLTRLCGRLPLALRIVAARLAARDALPVSSLVGQLTAHEDRLDQLELDDLSVRQSLLMAYESLRASGRRLDRRAADALVAVGALDLPEYSAPLLAGVLESSEAQAGAALDRLVDVALLDEVRLDRFVPHDLVRDFARELAEDVADRRRLTAAALRWFMAGAARSALVLAPELHRQRALPAVPSTGELDQESVLAWGDVECANLVVLAEHSARDGQAATELLTLVQALLPYLRARGRIPELTLLNELALQVALREQDRNAQGIALIDLAGAHFDTGRFAEALRLMDQALPLWRGLRDPSREQLILNNRGMLLGLLGRDEEAVVALQEALALAVEHTDPYNEALALSGLGNLAEKHDPRLAIVHHSRSIEAGKRCGMGLVQMSGLCNIGNAHLGLDEPAEALRHYRAALELETGSGQWHTERECRLGLVEALRRLRRLDEARAACRELLGLAAELQDTYGEGLARHVYGLVLRDVGEPAQALAQWRSALRQLATGDAKVLPDLRELIAAAEAADVA